MFPETIENRFSFEGLVILDRLRNQEVKQGQKKKGDAFQGPPSNDQSPTDLEPSNSIVVLRAFVIQTDVDASRRLAAVEKERSPVLALQGGWHDRSLAVGVRPIG